MIRNVSRPAVPLCFIDTETTEISHRRQPWDLAIIRRDPDGSSREFQAFVDVDLSDANPYSLDVGRFHERHPLGRWLASGTGAHPGSALTEVPTPKRFRLGVEDATGGYLTQREAALVWCRWTHGAHIVGAVPNFDTEIMANVSRSHGLLPSHHYHLGEIENLISGWLLGRVYADPSLPQEEVDRLHELASPPWDSDALFAELGITIPDEDRHTALGDARGVSRAWDALYVSGAR
jgi:hypothetical protein